MKNAKFEFFQRGRSIFFVKNFGFLQLCFLCKINKRKVFRNVFVKKQACLDKRNMDLKKGNLNIFWKGIVHDWVKKIISFSLSFLSKKNREKVFVDVLDRKEAFKDKKNRFLYEKNVKLEFFYRGKSIAFVKSFRFLQLCLLYKINKRKVFRNVFVKKQACLDNRNMDLKKATLTFFQRR